MKQLLFVYGTLKRGFARNNFLRDQRYIGIGRTEAKYSMFGYGGYPALVDDQLAEKSNVTAANTIYGELYEVDDACLMELDKVEGVDRDLFERKEIQLETLTITSLPMTETVWNSLARKSALAYFFKGNLNGAGNCGSLWVQK